MTHLCGLALILGLMLALNVSNGEDARAQLPPASAPRTAATEVMQFGVSLDSLPDAERHGLQMTFGAFWLGSWNTTQGWRHAEQRMAEAKRRNITPVINWWYWGDDISPQCVESGCYDARQKVAKDKATWYRLSRELSQRIEATMGGRETIVVLETEFNKGGIDRHEPFDGYLAELARMFKQRGNVKVVIGFGNWGREHWPRFDRAVAAADYLGTQMLRSSVHEPHTYASSVDALFAGAAYGERLFKKAPFVVDLALSSYPSATFEAKQAALVAELFARLPDLKSSGMRAILYRQLRDDPTFDVSNYHGVAERHFGFIRADGSAKPALAVFVEGVRRETQTTR